jgi:hypothetical protein
MAELKTIDSSTIVKCAVTFIKSYTNQAYKLNINQNIIQLTKEGLGIRSTARILNISTTTLLKRIVSIAGSISKPIISKGKTYEVDELCTYIRHKKNYIWLVYALEKNSIKAFVCGYCIRINIKYVYYLFKHFMEALLY